MKGMNVKWVIVLAIVICTAAPISFGGQREGSVEERSSGEITLLWAEWDPAVYLQELCDIYAQESGIKATVETVNWSDFAVKLFTELAARGDAYDLVVGDSQWLVRGSTQGHYVELTDWIKGHGVDKSMVEATMAGYSEYPPGGGTYWAVPLEGDAMGWAYRKDLFEDPKEKAAFEAKYGYELGVPESISRLADIAEFFYRPEENLYGVSIWAMPVFGYAGFENFLWAYGADVGDFETYRVNGILNSKQGIEALKMYKKLYGLSPPDWGNASFWDAN